MALISDPILKQGSDVKTTTAQWLYALNLAGFSGYAGSIPFVRS